MRVMTILGTRPEIIRLSRIILKLDDACEHILVNTQQNYDTNLNALFFKELGLRQPNHNLNVHTIGGILTASEQVLAREYLLNGERKIDKALVLGDTNTGLSALIIKRMGILLYHIEAGNRCYDDRVPEETNRRVIDHCSDVLMPYTERSRLNLIREGIAGERIYVIGNPIYEVLSYYKDKIAASSILDDFHLSKGKYILVTVHRAENVNVRERLTNIVYACSLLAEDYDIPVIFIRYPSTAKMMQQWDIGAANIAFYEPVGLFDFVKLEQNAKCVITDSGTVQEECCIFKVPNVTVRDVTERPETIECGSNMLAGANADLIRNAVKIQLAHKSRWKPPAEYLINNVSDKVIKIILGV